MALANTLTLDGVDGTDFVYVKRSSDANGSNYIDQATTLQLPGQLVFRHTIQGKGNSQADRHLVQVSKALVDSAGNIVVPTVNVTLLVPRNAIVTPTVVKHLAVNAMDFLTDTTQIASVAATTNIDALLRGES